MGLAELMNNLNDDQNTNEEEIVESEIEINTEGNNEEVINNG